MGKVSIENSSQLWEHSLFPAVAAETAHHPKPLLEGGSDLLKGVVDSVITVIC